MSGYVRIHRSLIGHPAFRNESETMAFAWMIAKASWKPTRVRYKGHSIVLQRGQLAISQRDMAKAFDRDKAWIERLWKRCKSEAMIETVTEAGVAVITICNYNDYQADSDDGEAPAEARGKAHNEAGARQRRGTEQRREEGKKNKSSVDKSTAAGPLQNGGDPVKEIFDLGVSLLVEAGVEKGRARSLLGKWRKAKGDGDVLAGLLECRRQAVSDPVEWLTKRFAVARYVAPSGYEYRGDLDAVIREAERRADWGTYWKAKGDRDKRVEASSSR